MVGGLVLHPVLSVAYGLSLHFVGGGSFVYHASAGLALGGQMDMYGIYVLSYAVLVLLTYYSLAALAVKTDGQDKLAAAASCGAWICICVVSWYGWDTFMWPGSWQKANIMLMSFFGVMMVSTLRILRT